MKRHIHNLNSAVEAVFANKFRSVLTALGIIFGVAAVIAMMAIGNGAQQEILEQMKMVGVNNIIITATFQENNGQAQEEEDNGEENGSKKNFSPGLTLEDVESIRDIIPGIEKICPEVEYNSFVVKSGTRGAATFSGVTPSYFEVYNLELQEGEMFNEMQLQTGLPVCIIGPEIKAKFFKAETPLGKQIKCGDIWLTVIGVLKSRSLAGPATEDLGISTFNNTVFVPIKTSLLRYRDRSLVTRTNMNRNNREEKNLNYNQLDKIVVQMKESSKLT
nr:ABC transporter permease [Bacteroidota bacterium]